LTHATRKRRGGHSLQGYLSAVAAVHPSAMRRVVSNGLNPPLRQGFQGCCYPCFHLRDEHEHPLAIRHTLIHTGIGEAAF
jgi:hypothetical protein